MTKGVDILGITAHPDDMELSASGTVLKAVDSGKRVAFVDLTEGELGTRGSKEIRQTEAEKSAKILGLVGRENLGLPDGFIQADEESLLSVIRAIRKFKPEVVITNAKKDRHPDHSKGNELVRRASFLSGLRKIETQLDGRIQESHRPKIVFSCIQDEFVEPDIVIDISAYWDKKMEAIMAFSSQFYDPNSKEPVSPISTKEFLEYLEGRARQFARPIGADYAEGFTVERIIGVNQITDIL